MADVNRLLTTKEAAQLLGVSKAFLERDRWAGATIPFVRIGSRTVRYRRDDLQHYIDGRCQRAAGFQTEVGTSDTGARRSAVTS